MVFSGLRRFFIWKAKGNRNSLCHCGALLFTLEMTLDAGSIRLPTIRAGSWKVMECSFLLIEGPLCGHEGVSL